jgi:hypothetical protein
LSVGAELQSDSLLGGSLFFGLAKSRDFLANLFQLGLLLL